MMETENISLGRQLVQRFAHSARARVMHMGESSKVAITRGKPSLLLVGVIDICDGLCHPFLVMSSFKSQDD